MDPSLYEDIAFGREKEFKSKVEETPEILLLKIGFEQNTALHLAVKYEKQKIVRFALKRERLLIFEVNGEGEIPLHLAARTGNVEITKLLLDSGTEDQLEEGQQPLKMVNNRGDTALHEAVREGHLEVVAILLSVDQLTALVENKAGESPLFLALERRFEVIARCILSKAPACSYGGSDGFNALHLAAFLKVNDMWTERREYYLEDLAVQRDERGMTPLHYAALANNHAAIDKLIKTNPKLACLTDKQGMTALHVAAGNGNFGIIMKFSEACLEAFEIRDSEGRTALHLAVQTDQLEVVDCIMAKPELRSIAKVTDNKGNTPLHYAVILDRSRIFSKLDKTVLCYTNCNGVSPRDIISMRGLLQILGTAPSMCSEKKIHLQCAKHTAIAWVSSFRETVREQPDVCVSSRCGGEKQPSEGSAKESRERDDKMRDINILVCALIATATFVVAHQVPGGYNSEGYPVLKNHVAFKVFFYANGAAFLFSIISISLCRITYGRRRTPKRFARKLPSPAGIFNFLSLLAALVSFLAGMLLVTQRIFPRADARSIIEGPVPLLCTVAVLIGVYLFIYT